MAMCQKEQKRSVLLVFIISLLVWSVVTQQPVIIYTYLCVSSVLYIIKKERFRPRVPKLNCRKFLSTVTGDMGVSQSQLGQELGMAQTG